MLWQAFGRWGGIGASAPVEVGPTPSNEGNGGWTDNASSSNDIFISYPSGPQAGDLILFHSMFNDPSTAQDINTPAGFTQIVQSDNQGFAIAPHALFYKISDGTESGTVQLTGTPGNSANDCFGGIMTLWRGVNTSSPYEGLATTTGSSVNMEGAAITTTGPNRRILHFCSILGQATGTAASGYSEVYDIVSTSGADGSPKLYEIERASAGTESAAIHTLSPIAQWHTIAIALVPA